MIAAPFSSSRGRGRTVPSLPLAFIGCLVAIGVFGLLSPGFASLGNFSNILAQVGVLALLTAGQALVMLVRGFDISVGASAATASTVAALAVIEAGPWGLVAGPLAGLLFGMANGLLVAYLRVQPIIATLATLLVARAIGRLISDDGQAVLVPPSDWLTSLGYGASAGIPHSAWLLLAVLCVLAIALRETALGRQLHMAGSSPTAAALVGVNVHRATLVAYATCGLLAGLAGVLLLARTGAGMPAEGSGLELQAIAAAILGGTALTGGVLKLAGTLAGALFIQIVLTGLNLLGLSPFLAQALLGLLICAAGIVEVTARRSSHRDH